MWAMDRAIAMLIAGKYEGVLADLADQLVEYAAESPPQFCAPGGPVERDADQ